jgi:hypothetical protein
VVLETIHSLLLNVRGSAIRQVVAGSARDSGMMAAAVLLATSYLRAALPRSDALVHTTVQPDASAMLGSCVHPSCQNRVLCVGNSLVDTSGAGDWQLQLMHFKTSGARGAVLPWTLKLGGKPLGKLLSAWSQDVAARSSPGSPCMLLHDPQTLRPISGHNWATSWKRALAILCPLAAEAGDISQLELDELVLSSFGSMMLPKDQRAMRHLWACVMDGRLAGDTQLSVPQLQGRREEVAKLMQTSYQEWVHKYTHDGYMWWLALQDWESSWAQGSRDLSVWYLQHMRDVCHQISCK